MIKSFYEEPIFSSDFQRKDLQVIDKSIQQLLDKNKAVYTLQFTQKGSNIVALAQLLNQHGLAYLKLYSEQPSLSDVFLSFTGKELRD